MKSYSCQWPTLREALGEHDRPYGRPGGGSSEGRTAAKKPLCADLFEARLYLVPAICFLGVGYAVDCF